WTRGQGWTSFTGPAAQVDSDVLSATSGGTGTLYLKADGLAPHPVLRFRPGVQGTLGPAVDVATNVTAVRGGIAGWAIYLQAIGAGSAPSIAAHPQSATVVNGTSH